MTRGARALLAVSALAVAIVAAHALGVGGARLDGIALNGAYNVAIATGALLCLLRARATPRERGAWLCLGLGLAAWGAAEVYWSLAYGSNGDPASPNPSDAGYLLYYPLAYAGLGLLVRDRVRELRLSMWLDGVVEGLVVSALAAALLAGPVFEDGAAGDPSSVAVTLAYPVLDLLLIGFVVAAFALAGWRPGRSLGLLGAGLAIGALADVLYLYQVAGQAGLGGLVDVLWPASVALIGLAAWQPPRRVVAAPAEGWRLVGIPVAAATAAALLVLGGAGSLNPVALALAAGGLAAALARMTLSIAENARMLKTSRREALTDGLTGLGNRRKLMVDLRHEIETAHQVDEYRVLALFDLDGFKLYNDSFGHPAGDALLARLGGRLAGAMGTTSEAYRMGGDEFCALVRVPKDGDETLVVREAALALSERGEGFTVDSSFGTVALPDEAYDPVEALQLADRRMYRHKDRRRSSARRQAHDVLLKVLDERQPHLRTHLRNVAHLAVAVAQRVGHNDLEVDEIGRAAELHDVGKMAIPDAILDRRGPLGEEEWQFIRQHTIIGERILAAAPSLNRVAGLVRSSHERWDGAGYPDGLGGEEIAAGRPHHRGLRRLRRDDLAASLPRSAHRPGGNRGAATRRGHAVRSGNGGRALRRAGRAPAGGRQIDVDPSTSGGSTRSSPRRSSRRASAREASSAVADSENWTLTTPRSLQ